MSEDFAEVPYDELKSRAIAVAEKRRDFGFFYDLFRHTPALAATADEGGSLGEMSGSILQMVEAAREMFGSGRVGEMEPLFRAVFEEYLTKYGDV